jgi:hypothetical protein
MSTMLLTYTMNNFELTCIHRSLRHLMQGIPWWQKKCFANSAPRMLCLTLKYLIMKCSKKGTGNPPIQFHWLFIAICDDIQDVQLKNGPILIWVIYLLIFTICYTTQLTCIYSKCSKWCPFISMHLSTCFTMFLATFLSVLSFFNHFCNSTFYWRLPSKFFKESLFTVGVIHRFKITFQKNTRSSTVNRIMKA